MEWTICAICGKPFGLRLFHTGEGGEVIRFADYVAPPPDSIGADPPGAKWICDQHPEEAKLRTDSDSL